VERNVKVDLCLLVPDIPNKSSLLVRLTFWKNSLKMMKSMEHWKNDADRVKRKHLDIDVPAPLRSAQISHGVKLRPPRFRTKINLHNMWRFTSHFATHNKHSALSLHRPIGGCYSGK